MLRLQQGRSKRAPRGKLHQCTILWVQALRDIVNCSIARLIRRSPKRRSLRSEAASPAGHSRNPVRMDSTVGSLCCRSISQSTVVRSSMPNGDSNPSICLAVRSRICFRVFDSSCWRNRSMCFRRSSSNQIVSVGLASLRRLLQCRACSDRNEDLGTTRHTTALAAIEIAGNQIDLVEIQGRLTPPPVSAIIFTYVNIPNCRFW
jgi:hypothetical protein